MTLREVPMDLTQKSVRLSTLMTPGMAFTFQCEGTKYVVAAGLLPGGRYGWWCQEETPHYVYLSTSNPTLRSKRWGEWFGDYRLDTATEEGRKQLGDGACLQLWDEVKHNFGPQYVEGHEEWGEVAL